MKRSILFLMIFLTFPMICVWAQDVAAPSATNEKKAGENDTGKMEFTGQVVASYDNEIFILKDDDQYVVIHMNPDHYKLGIIRGDEVEVWGTLVKQSPLKNEYKAITINKTKTSTLKVQPIGILSVSELIKKRLGNELIGTWGTVDVVEANSLTITDSSASIRVYLGSYDPHELYPKDLKVLVVGIIEIKPARPEITAVLIRPLSALKRPGEPEEAQSIETITQERPVGKMVKAKGRLGIFIGEVDAAILYEGDNVFLVYRSDKYLSLDPPAGQEVEVVGTFDVETHNAREYGVIKDARIVPLGFLKQVKRVLSE